MKYVFEKRPFYEKLKSFAGDNYSPIVFSHEFGDDLQYTICFEWSPMSVTGARNLMASCQLFDNRVSGFRKYIADDLHFNLIEVGATTDYKLYKFLRGWVQENIERYERKETED